MARAATTLLALLGWALATPALAQGYALKVGEHHPEFTLPDIQTGKPVSLADFRGKKVLLIQFASW
jgi:AhpC/TSA family